MDHRLTLRLNTAPARGDILLSQEADSQKNWTIEQSWDINELPVDQQKPQEIKKNKPKRKKGDPEEPRNGDEEEEDEFLTTPS